MKGVCKRGNISQNVSNIYLSSSVGTSFTEVLARPARPYFGGQSKRFRLKKSVWMFLIRVQKTEKFVSVKNKAYLQKQTNMDDYKIINF